MRRVNYLLIGGYREVRCSLVETILVGEFSCWSMFCIRNTLAISHLPAQGELITETHQLPRSLEFHVWHAIAWPTDYFNCICVMLLLGGAYQPQVAILFHTRVIFPLTPLCHHIETTSRITLHTYSDSNNDTLLSLYMSFVMNIIPWVNDLTPQSAKWVQDSGKRSGQFSYLPSILVHSVLQSCYPYR